jgi:hypothetical protein
MGALKAHLSTFLEKEYYKEEAKWLENLSYSANVCKHRLTEA